MNRTIGNVQLNPFLWRSLIRIKNRAFMYLLGVLCCVAILMYFKVLPRYVIFFGLPLVFFSKCIHKLIRVKKQVNGLILDLNYTLNDWIWLTTLSDLIVSVLFILMILLFYAWFTVGSEIRWSLSSFDIFWFVFFLIPLFTYGYFHCIFVFYTGKYCIWIGILYLLAIAVTVFCQLDFISYVLLTTSALYLINLFSEQVDVEHFLGG